MSLEFLLEIFRSSAVFLIFLGILVTVHEWGHFITAKMMGVCVQEFAFGFGPTLWSRKHNGTNYLIKLFPLGGYVKMAGDERAKCSGAPDEYYSKSIGARALIVFNGPLVNFILAYISFVLVFMTGYPGAPARVSALTQGGPAAEAGLLPGDRIVGVDGKDVYGQRSLQKRIREAREDRMALTVERQGEERVIEVDSEIVTETDMFGVESPQRSLGIDFIANKIAEPHEDFPAAEAGLKEGDVIEAVNGRPTPTWDSLQGAIRDSGGQTVELSVLRDQEKLDLTLSPKMEKRPAEDGEGETEVPIIGISPYQDIELTSFGPLQSFGLAGEEFVEITLMTYRAIYSMIVGSMSAKENVGGPVLIFNVVKVASEQGLSHFVFILGVISLNLAIFNLLPVIPLDGGHLALMLIEKIRGRAFSPKTDEAIAKIGFSLIIVLAIFVFYIDFDRIRLFEGIKDLFTPGK